MAKSKNITINELAVMVKRGFDETAKNLDVRFDETATKQDILRLEKEIASLREDIAHGNRIPASLGHRVDRAEDDIRLIKTKVGMR